jgi:hypothetical protein
MNHKWQGHAIAHPDDHKTLETEAAANELNAQKMPRQQAEAAAYASYKQKHHTEAAAHHLRNLRVAVAHGQREDATRHSALYTMHMQALGLNPHHPPPSGVQSLASKPMTEKSHRFTNHKGDQLLMGAPMNKSVREYLNCYRLAKSDGDGGGDIGADKPASDTSAPTAGHDMQQQAQEQPRSAPSPAKPASPDSASPSGSTPKASTAGHSHDDAGPQHYDDGSVVVYKNATHDSYVPPSWIGTVKAHHMLKIHSANSPGHKHFYELVWRTPEGRMVEDFLSQDELAPYRKSQPHG